MKNVADLKLWVLELLRGLKASYWFVPSIMATGAVVLAFSALLIDRNVIPPFETPPLWLTAPGPDAARSVLSTIAGSMITVAGVTFSIVIVALTVASSQFGPRILSSFLQDTGNQVALGTFVSAFLYCLVVLLHIPAHGSSEPLPHLSVFLSFVFAILSLGVLIFFIDHISTSLQAGHLVLESREELERVLKAQYPDKRPQGTTGDWPDFPEDEACPVYARRSGYLSRVNEPGLLDIASGEDLKIRMQVPPGAFVIKGQEVAQAAPAERVGEELAKRIEGQWIIVRLREQSEDIALAVDRLTEMAVRALSPGINDPYTACASIDRLVSAFALVMSRPEPVTTLHDDDNAPRLLRCIVPFEELLSRAFDPIRRYGASDPMVIARLLLGARRLRGLAVRTDVRDALGRLVEAMVVSAEHFELERDRLLALGEDPGTKAVLEAAPLE